MVDQRTVTVSDTRYNFAFRTMNLMATAVESVGLGHPVLDPDEILAAAARRVGHDDFGVPTFRAPLEKLIEAANAAPLTPLARVIARQTYVEAASTRLKLETLKRQDPTLSQTAVTRPVFVLGFPRTGTTVLQNMLSLDPQRRALEFWELTRPVPVLADPVRDAQKRIRTTKQFLRVAYLASPEMARVHEIKSTTPEECWPLFCPSFSVLNWDLGTGARSYGDFLMNHPMQRAYQEYKTLLQLLVSQRPTGHLVLKCPEHLWFLDALLAVFPDAAVVWTHRDPFKSIASYCSLISMQWRTMYGEFDPRDVGAHISQRFLEGVTRAMAVRERVGEDRFYDVNFSRLIKNEQSVLDGITEKFGLTRCDPEAVAGYLGNKRGDAMGKHRYSPEMYGIDRLATHARFADYISRFGIALSKG